MTNAQILVLALIAYLAAAVTGAEYAHGTIRTSPVANVDRRGFFVVRLVALALAADPFRPADQGVVSRVTASASR